MNTSSLDNASVEEDVYIFPASFSQESLWFLDQLEPNRAIYNISSCFRLTGLLNSRVLEQVLHALIQRHETLRTSFMVLEGQLVQVISPTKVIPLQVVDLRNLPKVEQESETLRLATAEAQRPFDLTRGPLLRTTVLQLAAEEHMLLLTIHHIVFDEWSMRVLCQEFAALYTAFVHEQPSPLLELPIQYADFVVWQRQWLQDEVLATQISYWREHLSGVPAVLELSTDHPRPAVQTFRGAQHHFVLSQELADALKALSRHKGVTLFMTLLAAFKVLLYRYTGQTDMVVGSPIADRNRSGMEGLIGFFLNMLVLRTDLSESPSFEEVLRRVGEVALGAYAHQDLPFEKLVEQLNPERNMSYHPLFQALFTLRSDPPSAFDLPGLHLQLTEIENETAKFDLSLTLKDTEQGLTGTWEYSTELFELATISRMGGHFQTLLEGILANPKQLISELPLLTADERQQVLVEWNTTKSEYPLEQCLHQLFEEQVKRTPEAVAVVFEDRQLTYWQLNRRANQLAHYLQQWGVRPDVLVGLYVERSLDMVIGLLGILKAGGAYVPLDPGFPSERLTFMVEDAQASVLITQQHLRGHLPAHKAKVVCLDTDQAVLAQQSETNLPPTATPAHLAYVIYTSGSAGRPKGVQIIHRAVVNFLLSMRQRPGLRAEDTLLAVTTLSFDIAALELFLPLVVGARVVIASTDVVADGAALMETLTHTRTTVMQATPVTWRLLLAAGWQGNQHLKILCGGEALPQQLAQQLLPRAASLWNLYGPTETTIWSSACQIEAGDKVVTIGHPIANTQLYILDGQLQLVPIGIPGQLYIGGDGLARGYLNRPELTAESFISHPFSDEPGARLYKTGDLARYRVDGTIEHLGRLDFQVKLRGFRIELGEIEALLNQHPAVQSSIVLHQEDIPGDARLIAYLTVKQRHIPSLNDLRSYLRKKLPDYMIPSAFLIIDALPLTPNGKVDRRALPKVEGLLVESETAFVAPQTESERTIAAIWQEVLGVKKVGVQDNFFDLGGNSLLLAQVHSKIQAILKRNIMLLELFEYPTVSSLVEHLNPGRPAPSSPQGNLGRAEVRRESMRRQQQIRQQRRKMPGEQEIQAE
ncbi:MAG TPA: amino acid adenylation domain-containing protein [Ktedonobacteraceae bacterium]|jgi:amino acid adenylation domain-containing protein